MGIESKAQFKVDKTKCIKCGRCVNTCSGMVIKFGKDGYPELIPYARCVQKARKGKIHRYSEQKK